MVNGIGDLYFDAHASRNMTVAKQNIYNQKNYFGYTIIMATKYSIVESESKNINIDERPDGIYYD